ncbi:protein involved in plasmid replication-relaxation [Murinocardiopsis flavida]|uniref:Protein involved in plasmid replication-relaxation n=1 Tax=Murinocardiopsis flavida TaxID=645275 RepID=A0A2P8DG91_9ACTN|nr:replication-relaxation family protein [Murinocardiopsis flavida]PSK96234.1 protein involved in plasmid replication-relaxation [Murinocardiopsis flavida]
MAPAARARTALASRLTPRDRAILDALHTHRVLTTHHIAALFYSGHTRRTRTRLATLHDLGAVERFRPHRTSGSAPVHWVLAPAGARALAEYRGIDIAELGYRPDRALAIAHSSRLAHTTGILDVMTVFTTAARSSPGAAVETWWGEVRCAREWGRHARPDAYTRIHTGTARIDLFIEYDTGTEPLERVAAKLPGYAALAAATAITTPVAVITRGHQREAHLAEVLTAATTDRVPVWLSTADRITGPGPAAPVWRRAAAPSRHSWDALAA